VSNHLRADFDAVEDFAIVDSDNGADQLRHNNHVAEVGSAFGRLLVGGSILLGGTELADETHGLASETTRQTPAGAGMEESTEIIGAELEEAVKFHATVRELAEGSALLQLGGGNGIVFVSHLVGR